MERLLFLVHRIPYPPDKGDKIRSYHLLRHLTRHYRVHLGAFVDDPEDWKHADVLRGFCEDMCLVALSPGRARPRSVSGLFTGEPLSLPYYRNRRLASWVRTTLESGGFSRILAFSSPTAQYVLSGERARNCRRVCDFVDVDSDKWLQYGRKTPWPMSWVYDREGRRLLEFERRVAADFDASVFVSEAEAEMFRRLAPDSADKVTAVENGVDEEFFSPESTYPKPYSGSGPVLVFTGAMDYWANVDAVTWFADEVLPRIRHRHPGAEFYIVGARPTDTVVRLGRREGITVTGRVEDIRPYLAHARVSVAPLRIARGIQNKVLEAMSMGVPVVASPQAMEGIDLGVPYPLLAETTHQWLERLEPWLSGQGDPGFGRGCRGHVRARYGWERKAERMSRVLEGDIPASRG